MFDFLRKTAAAAPAAVVSPHPTVDVPAAVTAAFAALPGAKASAAGALLSFPAVPGPLAGTIGFVLRCSARITPAKHPNSCL